MPGKIVLSWGRDGRGIIKIISLQAWGNRKENRIMNEVPINEKYTLTIKEASQYFNIGIKKMRRLAEENTHNGFAVHSGNRYLIIRSKFEKYLVETSAI